MFSKKLGGLVAASLMVASTSAIASPASQLSPAAYLDRASAPVANTNEMGSMAGGGLWAALIGVALIAAFVLVVVEDEDDDLPDSP